jgi:ribonuclease E
VLEEKRDSDEDDDDDDDDEEDENLDTDEEGNVFDKLLRRTRDPGRKALVESVDPGGKGGVRLMDSSEDSEDSSDQESDDQEQEEEDNEPPSLQESNVKKRGKEAESKTR